jgi:putative transposase
LVCRPEEATGQRRRFASVILPAWCRTSPKITEVLPLLYLHGLSSQDFAPALEGFLGSGAGLSAVTITRLTVQWQDEARAFGDRDLSSVDSGCLWADGVHLNVRLDSEKLCLLVMVGVRVDGTKELIALTEGYRESTGSWADLLRDCARRGMRAPVLAVGDGSLGFWSALREVFPTTRLPKPPTHPHLIDRRTFQDSPAGTEPAAAPRFSRTPSPPLRDTVEYDAQEMLRRWGVPSLSSASA